MLKHIYSYSPDKCCQVAGTGWEEDCPIIDIHIHVSQQILQNQQNTVTLYRNIM